MMEQPIFPGTITPIFELSKGMDSSLQSHDVGDKFKATISYEVVEKTENEVTLEIRNIFFKTGKRKI